MLTPKKRSIFEELNASHYEVSLDQRGENAWGAAVKFLTALEEAVPEPDTRRKLMNSWIRAIKDKDYTKFKSALRRYERKNDEK